MPELRLERTERFTLRAAKFWWCPGPRRLLGRARRAAGDGRPALWTTRSPATAASNPAAAGAFRRMTGFPAAYTPVAAAGW
jgi:hypothetical protein